jgi:rare lipoprotein A
MPGFGPVLAAMMIFTGIASAAQSNSAKAPKPHAISRSDRTMVGLATYYSPKFAGRKTASGERYNPKGYTAAHRTLPFGTRVRITNLRNGKSVVVRINDRGPVPRKRIVDVSYAAAVAIGLHKMGVCRVRIDPEPVNGSIESKNMR